MKKIPMLERFAAQSLVESDGELIFSKEKFAELIVRRFVELLDKRPFVGAKRTQYIYGYIQGRVDAEQQIKQHFGVEE